MSLFKFLYFGTAGLAGCAYHTREKYIESNRKPGSAIYSLGYGIVIGIPTGMLFSVAAPVFALFALRDEAEHHFKKE